MAILYNPKYGCLYWNVIFAIYIIFIATKAADTEAASQYAVELMGGNIAWWINEL